MSPEMQADMDRWQAAQAKKNAADRDTQQAFDQAAADLKNSFSKLPEKVDIPFNLTPEGERFARFQKVCEPEFLAPVDRSQLVKPWAFDKVANWDGQFPGRLAHGPTGTGKTRAAWQALGRNFIKENRAYAWFPVKRLITQLAEDESRNMTSEFFRRFSAPHVRVLMVDDLDKINWQFDSEIGLLFQFYDWVYRSHIACITTTNKPRDWWADRAGEAFVRRLFDDCHTAVDFA